MPTSRAISPGCGVMMTSRPRGPPGVGIVGEGVEPVGVEHERHRRPVDERLDERATCRRPVPSPGRPPRRRAPARARDRRPPGRAAVAAALGDRFGHVLRRHRRDDRLAAIAGVATVTRPGARLAARPNAARWAAPVLPREPATISTRPKSPLWVSGARGVTSARIAIRVSSSTRGPSSASKTTRRDADVGDDDVAGARFGRRQHERQLRRAERDGERPPRSTSPIGSWRVGGQARRQVDRHDRDAGRVDVGDHGLDQARRAAR